MSSILSGDRIGASRSPRDGPNWASMLPPSPNSTQTPAPNAGTKRTAKIILSADGKVEKILIDENASPASAFEEGVHVAQSKDPVMRKHFEKLDPGTAWADKKQTVSGMSGDFFDDVYDRAMKAGSLGGKLLGAGGGGFFLFYAEPDKREAVRQAVTKCLPCLVYDFAFTPEGSSTVSI